MFGNMKIYKIRVFDSLVYFVRGAHLIPDSELSLNFLLFGIESKCNLFFYLNNSSQFMKNDFFPI